MTSGMASDTRGHSLESESSTQPKDAKTYANAFLSRTLPTKEQVIIADSIESFTNDDYIDGIETLIEAGHVRFISKVSGNRIKIYLSDKSLVEKVIDKPVTIKGHEIKFRSLITNNKRRVISNVDPTIPRETIFNFLKSKSVTPVSAMHYLRVGLLKPGRANILSFRRQVYIKEEDEQLVPESTQIPHEDTPYWIYFTTDSTKCYLCKQSRHIARVCPQEESQFLTQKSFPPLPQKDTQIPQDTTQKVQEDNTLNTLSKTLLKMLKTMTHRMRGLNI